MDAGYLIACLQECHKSEYFPKPKELQLSSEDMLILLSDQFDKWLLSCSKEDVAFKYRSEVVAFWGPLMHMYDKCIQNNDAVTREAIWFLLLPVFLQFRKPNYSKEPFVFVVNIVAKWPRLIREIILHNCSVNLSDTVGSGIALDEFVESQIVRPLKAYFYRGATLKTLKVISGNLEVFSPVRFAYKSKQAFDISGTKKHSEADPVFDQLKVAWWCRRNKFFCFDLERKRVKVLDYNGAPGYEFLPRNLTEIYAQGREKLKQLFKRKMFESFPETRYVCS